MLDIVLLQGIHHFTEDGEAIRTYIADANFFSPESKCATPDAEKNILDYYNRASRSREYYDRLLPALRPYHAALVRAYVESQSRAAIILPELTTPRHSANINTLYSRAAEKYKQSYSAFLTGCDHVRPLQTFFDCFVQAQTERDDLILSTAERLMNRHGPRKAERKWLLLLGSGHKNFSKALSQLGKSKHGVTVQVDSRYPNSNSLIDAYINHCQQENNPDKISPIGSAQANICSTYEIILFDEGVPRTRTEFHAQFQLSHQISGICDDLTESLTTAVQKEKGTLTGHSFLDILRNHGLSIAQSDDYFEKHYANSGIIFSDGRFVLKE